MTKKNKIKLVTMLLVITISSVIYVHYSEFRKHLFIHVAFLDENKQVYPIELIAQFRAIRVDLPINKFLENNNNDYLKFKKFLSALDKQNVDQPLSQVDPKYYENEPEETEQGAREFVETWKTRRESIIEYVFPGEVYSYLIHSFLQTDDRVWVAYRFRMTKQQVYFSPAQGNSFFHVLLGEWIRAISEGWYGGIAPENRHYQTGPLSYLEYWQLLWRFNSKLKFDSEENDLTLHFNSYAFSGSQNKRALEIERLADNFLTSLRKADSDEFSNYVTENTFGRLKPIFTEAYQENYRQFIESFEGVKLVSYIDAHPIRIVYISTENKRFIETMFVFEQDGEIRFGGIGYEGQSPKMFRNEKISSFMVDRESME